MSVFTPLTPTELAPWLARYDLGAILSLEGIAAGVVNTNYRLETERGKYILTVVEGTEEDLPHTLDLLTHLSGRQLPCPTPMADRGGRVIQELKGKPALIVTCLHGRSAETPTPAQCHAAGRTLARMHLLGRDFPSERENPVGPTAWRILLDGMVEKMREGEASTLALFDGELLRIESDKAFDDLPGGVIHADFFPDNALFEGGALTGMIDFYFACRGAWIYDLAITLDAWGFHPDGTPHAEALRALWTGYNAVRLVTPGERRKLGDALRRSSLRFALTRQHDALFPRPGENVTKKPPETFIRRLRFHRDKGLGKALPV